MRLPMEECISSALSLFTSPQPNWDICNHDLSEGCVCSGSHLRYTVLQGEPYDGIGRLPTEMLAEIFVHALSSFNVGDFAPDTVHWKRIDQALVIMGVCHRWRQVMLARVFSRIVWNKIPCSARSGNFVELLLERSKDQPISLNIAHPSADENHRMTLYKLVSTQDRIESLCVFGWRARVAIPFSRPEMSFPRLHTLVLSSSAPYCDVRPCDSTIDQRTLGCSRLPSLRTLRILTHTHLLATRMAASLQELQLHCVRNQMDLIQSLAHVPFLRILKLDRLYDAEDVYHNLPPPTSIPSTFLKGEYAIPTRVPLDALQVLTVLWAGGAALATFLGSLSIPESATVFTRCLVESERDQQAWPDLAQVVTRHLRDDGDFGVSSVRMQIRWPISQEGAIMVQCLSPSTDTSTNLVTLHPRLTLHVHSRNHLSYSDVLVELSRCIPPHAVADLQIRSSDVRPRNGAFVDLAFPAIFACFPNVGTLELFGNIAPALYALSLPSSYLSCSVTMHRLHDLILHDTSSQTMSRIAELQQLLRLLHRVRSFSNVASVLIKQTIWSPLHHEERLDAIFAVDDKPAEIMMGMQRLVEALATRFNPSRKPRSTM
ncbi:unnamed protein product [Peniophora sp. CBMAI 1063]|nr:unnamed protein product [Peniophora sp. CBMAI 1063]